MISPSRRVASLVLIASPGGLALAQTAAPPPPPASSASAPIPRPKVITNPGGPTWMIGLVLVLIVGIVAVRLIRARRAPGTTNRA